MSASSLEYCQLRLYADEQTAAKEDESLVITADVIKFKILYFSGVVDEVASNFNHYLELARSIELAARKAEVIAEITAELAKTDYKALRFAEGKISAADYVAIDEAREALRVKIRTVENATSLVEIEGITSWA